MIRDGFKLRKTRKYGYRNGNPFVDVDTDGKPVQSNYIVIVKLSDCKVKEKEINGIKKKFYDPTGVNQAIKLGYGGTYYGYAKNNKVYFVEDGKVYIGK